MKWNQELNPSQLKAADQINGQLLILAGAGSGKTKTLTHRIAHMIEEGIPADKILAITFTNKAAKEMKDRIYSLLGDVRQPKACTFHSLGFEIVKSFAELAGYMPHVGICDAEDSRKRLKTALAEVEQNQKYKKGTYTKNKEIVCWLESYISSAKDQCLYFYEADDGIYNETGVIEKKGDFKEAYKIYQEGLVKDNQLDFDDLIMVPALLLENNEEIAKLYWNKWNYISVDEYQDTSKAQFRLVHRLAEGNGNICVVGDDYQSIYAFRGADITNILSFQEVYPGANVVTLGENYRSTSQIVDGASAVIANNEHQMHKHLFSMQEKGKDIQIGDFYTYKKEAAFIAHKIKEGAASGKSYNDFAVLYRANALSRFIEDALIEARLPYVIYGGISFYARKEVKDIVAYLKMAACFDDTVAFARIINTPKRSIGKVATDRIINGIHTTAGDNLQMKFLNYAKEHEKKNVISFAQTLYSFAMVVEEYSLSQLIHRIIDVTGYIDYLRQEYKKDEDAGQDHIENVQELVTKAMEFEAEYLNDHQGAMGQDVLEAFLENIALLTDMDQKKENVPTVKLMTMHASKGLEFDTVFMVGCEQRTLIMDPMEKEEERRLFYVGMTRAKKELYITHSDSRVIYGEVKNCVPIEFIREIPKQNSSHFDTKTTYFG